MSDSNLPARTVDVTSLGSWLRRETTIRLPNWAMVAGGVVAAILVGVALD